MNTLRYVTDTQPGYTRCRVGRGFRFCDSHGHPPNGDTAARLRALAIPPAWTDVWICPDPNGHIQATGRDVRRRKQYIYHPDWTKLREENKSAKMLRFAEVLPKIRRRVKRDLTRKRGLHRDRVLATVVRLLESTLIRIGNREYARANRSYGLTTLRDHHVEVRGPLIHFRFRGKSGRHRELAVEHPLLARIVRECQELPGQELFQYVDGRGQVRDIGSGDVNQYLREISGEDITAKDFRTWSGTVLAARALAELKRAPSRKARARQIRQAVGAVAELLGNTPAVCRQSYIHPAILDAFEQGTPILNSNPACHRTRGLRQDEAAVYAYLSQAN